MTFYGTVVFRCGDVAPPTKFCLQPGCDSLHQAWDHGSEPKSDSTAGPVRVSEGKSPSLRYQPRIIVPTRHQARWKNKVTKVSPRAPSRTPSSVRAHLVLPHFTDSVFSTSAASKSIGTIFPAAFVHFLSLHHILVILPEFQNF